MKTIAAVTKRAHAALRFVSVLLLAFYLTLVLLQVFFRYVLNASLFWSEETVRYSLVWGVMLGSALVAYERGHVRIDLLDGVLPPAVARVTAFVANALTFAFCLILVWTGIQFVERTIFQSSASLGVPMWAVYSAIPVGAALEAWFMLVAWATEGTQEGGGDVLL
jgi:TRAP-type C4-dicarboxylate transport system permease small subunit